MAVCNNHSSKGPVRPYRPYDGSYNNDQPHCTAADAYSQARADETELACIRILPDREHVVEVIEVE